MYQALYRKYRSRTFDDVVGQDHITRTLKSQVESGKLSHAYLFTGTRGTGKTSCAKILARAVNCENPSDGNPCNACPSCIGIENGAILDVLEIDAASNNGVDNVRALREEAVYSPASVKKRVYIIDEVHMLSGAAFNALLKIMEEPPEHLVFILATTELNKVPATILSRCQRFGFRRIGITDIEQRIKFVARSEGIEMDEQAANLLARMADGALRDALSLLDQCSADGQGLTVESVYDALGLAGNLRTAKLMEAVSLGDVRGALDIYDELYKAGKDIAALLGELTVLCRDVLVTMVSKNGLISAVGSYDDMTLKSIANKLTVEALVDIISELQNTIADISKSANQRIEGEMCLIRICDASVASDMSAIAARISKLEKRMDTGLVTAPVRIEVSEPEIPPEPKVVPDDNEASEPPVEAEPQPHAPLQIPKETESENECSSWLDIVTEVRPDVSIMEYVYLSNPEMVKAFYHNGQLTLAVGTEFVLNMINNDEVISAVKRSAKSVLGADVNPRITLASALKKPEKDNLAALKQRAGEYDNIIIK